MDTDTKLEVFTAKVSEWMETTTEYRRSLCKKIDEVKEKINELPCPERAEANRGMRAEMNWIRGLIAAILLALAGLWLK